MIDIKRPRSMADTKALTDGLAAELTEMRKNFWSATRTTPEDVAHALVARYPAGTAHRHVNRREGIAESALSAAQDALAHAADAMTTVYAELRRFAPDDTEWF